MKQLKDALVFRGVPGPPRSAKQLIQRFPGNSVTALLRAAASDNPELNDIAGIICEDHAFKVPPAPLRQ